METCSSALLWKRAESRSFPSIWQCGRRWNVGMTAKRLQVHKARLLCNSWKWNWNSWYTLVWLTVARYAHSGNKPTRLPIRVAGMHNGKYRRESLFFPAKKKIGYKSVITVYLLAGNASDWPERDNIRVWCAYCRGSLKRLKQNWPQVKQTDEVLLCLGERP